MMDHEHLVGLVQHGSNSFTELLYRRVGATLSLRVRGELDHATVPELERTVHDLLDGVAHVDWDLSEVTFADAAAVGLVIATHGTVTDAGGTSSVSAASAAVRQALGATETGDVVGLFAIDDHQPLMDDDPSLMSDDERS